MMESICLDEPSDVDDDWHFVEHGFPGPRTPSTTSDEQNDGQSDQPPHKYDLNDGSSDEEYGTNTQQGAPRQKKGGYDSRIEQILYENPDLPILIVDAGKSLESGGKYIVYTIRTGVRS